MRQRKDIVERRGEKLKWRSGGNKREWLFFKGQNGQGENGRDSVRSKTKRQ